MQFSSWPEIRRFLSVLGIVPPSEVVAVREFPLSWWDLDQFVNITWMLCFEVTEIKTAFLYSEISTKVDFVSKYFIKSFSYCGGGGTRTEEPSVVSRMLSPLYYGYASASLIIIEYSPMGRLCFERRFAKTYPTLRMNLLIGPLSRGWFDVIWSPSTVYTEGRILYIGRAFLASNIWRFDNGWFTQPWNLQPVSPINDTRCQ